MRIQSVAPFFIAIISLFVSCNKKLSYEQAIKRSYGKEVNFSWNKKYIQEDTVVFL